MSASASSFCPLSSCTCLALTPAISWQCSCLNILQHTQENYTKNGKGVFYTAQYPVRWPAQSVLNFTPGRPADSATTSASLGSILAMQQLRVKTIQKCPTFKTVAKGIQTRALSIASSVGVWHSTAQLPRHENVLDSNSGTKDMSIKQIWAICTTCKMRCR